MSQRSTTPPELNLLPVMNLVSILIPMLLMSAQMVQLSVIEAAAPAIADERPEPQPEPEPYLRVAITAQGVSLSGLQLADGEPGDATFACTIDPCDSSAAYPLTALGAHLSRLKSEHPETEQAVVDPGGDVPFEVVMAVMDALREIEEDGERRTLFASVSFAGGS